MTFFRTLSLIATVAGSPLASACSVELAATDASVPDGGNNAADAGTRTIDAEVPATDPWDQPKWPAEARAQATSLFLDGPSPVAGQNNWSGAHFNPITQSLWLARNDVGFRSYGFDGSVFTLANDFVLDADFEAITQASGLDDHVYVLAENQQELRLYAIDGASAALTTSWDVSALSPEADGLEGLAFVANDVLVAQGFVDGQGAPYTSANPSAGVFLLSHQNGGHIYVIDLDAAGGLTVVGEYIAPLESTRGLELDAASQLLFMVDGNTLQHVSVCRARQTMALDAPLTSSTRIPTRGPSVPRELQFRPPTLPFRGSSSPMTATQMATRPCSGTPSSRSDRARIR